MATVPITLFSGVIVSQLVESQRQATMATLSQRAEAGANAVAARLSTTLGGLDALATAEAMRAGNLAGLYEHGQRLQALYPEILAISLVNPEGQQIFNTLRPLDEALPPSSAPEMIRRILGRGQPMVSSPFLGTLSRQMAAAVGIRVMLGGTAPHVLRIGIATSSFHQVLADQHLPQGWPSVLFDQNGTLVARTPAAEISLGQKVSPELQAILRQGHDGVFKSVARDGQPMINAVFKVPDWDWWVAVYVPVKSFDAARHDFLLRLTLAGLVSLAASWGVAMWLSRRLAGKIRHASRATLAAGDGGRAEFRTTGIVELDAIGTSLDALRLRETQARRDALTGLAGRGWFLERAEWLRARSDEDDQLGLAVLLLDLDGFKQVNDTLGHDRGDEVLIRTADILSAVVRDGDVAGRLGGDEFVICVLAPRGEIRATAAAIAHRVLAAVGEIGLGVGCSIGISIAPPGGASLAYLMREADAAMYAAKHAGKNRAVVQETPVETD